MHRNLNLPLAATVLVLAGCSKPEHSAAERYYLVTSNIKIPYWQAAAQGLEKAARQMNVRAEMVGPDRWDNKAQLEDLRRVIGQKPAGILVSASDAEMLKPAINQAIAAGIPVITMDSDAPGSQRLLFIGTNNYQVGVTGARVLAQRLGGKGNVAVFTIPAQPNLNERLHGYEDGLATHPGIRITNTIDSKGDAGTAFDEASSLIDSKAPINAFVCLEATACKEIADVLDRKRVTDKIVIAMDTDQGTLDWIEKGKIAATIGQRPYTMAYYGLKVLDDLHHHPIQPLSANWSQNPSSPIPAVIDTGSTLIDKSNLSSARQSGS
ncbi:MAG TPA: substrate-binding domain-containing protein [Bryobacteraceae bacterium]|nr:substrate-binding domain-containing protein [Bryobacteraceae bacterium]